MAPDPVLEPVGRYYGAKVAEHGPTAKGVDWNDEASQELRFAQLTKVCDLGVPFTINDDRCGCRFAYTGFDISERMLEQARARARSAGRRRFVADDAELPVADYTLAS